ncbi:hypothetical protein [Candidatus Bealeia paramacronuclearis]|uniref:hypothetical protein n=1 Tax=Candidatus Bealeia paramacronuclearis TaxID=1921001 RepID=UPI002F25FEB7
MRHLHELRSLQQKGGNLSERHETIFHEIDTTHPVNVKIANQGLIMFETPNVFPEYFIISLPRFNDQVQHELDEWLYMMKHSEVLLLSNRL